MQTNKRISPVSVEATFPTVLNAIASVNVNELVRVYGTPLYVYDAAKIVESLADLARWDVVRYAQKACSNLAILDLVRRHGALVDCVSEGELRRALRAGFSPHGDPPPVVFTADVFDRGTLEFVVERNIHVNCGSPDMIEQLGRRAPGREITLRINPGFGHGHSQKTNTGGEQSKHGIWHEQLGECLRRADHHGLCVTGLHMHIGSGTDLEHLSRVAAAMEKAAVEVGRMLKTVSAGGGLPIPYQEGERPIDLGAYFELWDTMRRRLEASFGHPVSLEIEPGRYIAAESGFLVAELRAVKQMGKNTFYLLDAGFNTLPRPILYGAYHPISIVPAEGSSDQRPLGEVVVGGPLCESGDIFTQREGGFVETRRLPQASVGERLVFHCAGAYASVMASNYNSHYLPAEVLIEDGRPRLIRRRQTFDDLIRGETTAAQSDAWPGLERK